MGGGHQVKGQIQIQIQIAELSRHQVQNRQAWRKEGAERMISMS